VLKMVEHSLKRVVFQSANSPMSVGNIVHSAGVRVAAAHCLSEPVTTPSLDVPDVWLCPFPVKKPDTFTYSAVTKCSSVTPLLHPGLKPGHDKLKHATCDSTHAAVSVSNSN